VRRHDTPINGADAISREFNELWEELRRLKSSVSPSMLPEGFTWDQDGNDLVVVGPTGTRTPIT
jgi:hypothetical protein